MRSLLSRLWRLARTWWRVDRIRTSAAESRLLGLEPPCVTILDGEVVQVIDKEVLDSPAGLGILYCCMRPDGRDRLLVTPGSQESKPVVEWLGPDGCEGITCSERPSVSAP